MPRTILQNGRNSSEVWTRDSRTLKRQVSLYITSIAHTEPVIIISDSEIASVKTKFSIKFNSALWFMTTGLQFFIGWWYRKSAVFYLPQGWFGPLTWWLGLPWAPFGSISCGVWQMACRRFILVMERTAKELWGRSTIIPLILIHLNSSTSGGTTTGASERKG